MRSLCRLSIFALLALGLLLATEGCTSGGGGYSTVYVSATHSYGYGHGWGGGWGYAPIRPPYRPPMGPPPRPTPYR